MLGVHLKTALDYIRRFPFQAAAVILVFANMFFVTTVLIVLVYSSNNLLKAFETRPQIIAFLQKDAPEDQVFSVQSRYESDSRVEELNYINQEQAFEIYKGAGDYNPLLEELVNPSVFPASLELALNDLAFAEEIISELQSESIVDQVGFTANLGPEEEIEEVVQNLRKVSFYIRSIGGGFVAFQILTSFIVLLVIISIRMTVRKGEIEILRLIGATNWFIKLPIVFESLFYTVTGALIGWVSGLLLFLYSSPSILNFASSANVKILPTTNEELLKLFGVIFLAEYMIALALGLFGSLVAASRSRSYD